MVKLVTHSKGKDIKKLETFIKSESTAGIVLIVVTLMAKFLQNSPLSTYYNNFLHTQVEVRFGNLQTV